MDGYGSARASGIRLEPFVDDVAFESITTAREFPRWPSKGAPAFPAP
jgi:hypothetical protein